MINNNWVFGINCGLDFSTSPAAPIPTSGNSINTLEGCASISDSAGNLLFYTDGITIWDSFHAIRYNALLGNSSSTQSAIIVPDPNNNQQYYIFTADGSSGTNNHFNGGLLNVNTWSFTLLSSIMTLPNTTGFSPVEKVTAIQHANCKDFWVLTVLQELPASLEGTGIIRIFLVNSSGVSHSSDIPLRQIINDLGYLKGSPDGNRIALANWTTDELLVFPFDKATGNVNIGGVQSINTSGINEYGVEFSPNSSLLYYTAVNNSSIFQVDLTGSLTPTTVGNIPGTNAALQLGIDNRIYIAKLGQSSLAAILNPNILGTGCNVNNTFITLNSGSQCRGGLPNIIANLCPDSDCECNCKGCNTDAQQQNDDLIQRADIKTNTIPSTNNAPNCPTDPFPVPVTCRNQAISSQTNLEPCFYFHWGDGSGDQIEEHDTEVFYLTICNNFNDILFKGLRINSVTLNPSLPISSAHIVPDRLITIDCLEPCSCQTREFAMITRDNNIAGSYTLDVEYCYDEIVIASRGGQGTASFPLTIIED